MNDPLRADAVRTQMKRIRRDIDQGMQDIDQHMEDMVDWRHYVRTYPWICLGTAAMLGFLIVPKRSTTKRVLHSLSELAKSGHLADKPALIPTRGLVGGLLATVASLAIREATAYVGRSAGRSLGITLMRPSQSLPAATSDTDRARRSV